MPTRRTTKKSARGGARPGAGRKPGPGPRMRSVPLVLTLDQIQRLDTAALREGVSRSAALRQMLDCHPAAVGTAPLARPAPSPAAIKGTSATAKSALNPTQCQPSVKRPRKTAGEATARSPRAAAPIYHLKVSLLDVEPRIWRRLQVTGDTLLSELHSILQIAMGWEGFHLHQFQIGGACVGNTGSGGSEAIAIQEVISTTRPAAVLSLGPHTTLMRYDERFTFYYEYDMGDFWQHEIVVEKVTKASRSISYPRCTAGAQVGPPEDCGGAEAYSAKLRRRRRKPLAFDRQAVNTALQNLKFKHLAAG